MGATVDRHGEVAAHTHSAAHSSQQQHGALRSMAGSSHTAWREFHACQREADSKGHGATWRVRERLRGAGAYRSMTNYTPKQRGALQRLLTPERAAKLAEARARRRERLRGKQNAKQALKQQRKQLVGSPRRMWRHSACHACLHSGFLGIEWCGNVCRPCVHVRAC